MCLAAALPFVFGGTAFAEVPIPRLSPLSAFATASLGAVPVPDEPAPPASIGEAIARELTVDVSLSVAEFYEARDFAPVWDAERAAALRARLAAAAGDGLDPRDYFVPAAGSGIVSEALADISLTEAALRFARHAYSGRVKPSSVSAIIDFTPPVLNEQRFLGRIAHARNLDHVLDSVQPRHPQYLALRERLRAILKEGGEQPPAVGAGPSLKLGVSEPRVAVLRSRLGATVPRGTDATLFDEPLADAVKAWQADHGLSPDGIVGPRTLALLDRGLGEEPTAALVSNMERWRWLPRDLGQHIVFVNVPAYHVTVTKDGAPIYDGRVVVGKSTNATPLLASAINNIVVNPYWNVPVSIASKEMLGGIRANPAGYFARNNYEAVVNGKVVNPASIAWNTDSVRRVRIRQKPGRGNALGSIKFLFDNGFSVYLHDTPSKSLFARDDRAFSHGCVRVDQPFAFADALLAADDKLSGRALEKMVGGDQRWLKVRPPVPVYLAYFTVEIGKDGRVRRHDDIYGFDARTQKALGL